MKKKGQVKFGETFGIIFLVYIIIMVGMIWYNNVNTNTIEKLNDEAQRARASEKFFFIQNSNLLHKSELGDVDEDYDYYSLISFQEYSKGDSKEYIRKQLGESTIVVELYNKDLDEVREPIVLYNNTVESKDGTRKKIETFRSLIPVKDSIKKETNMGVLIVKIYN